MMSARDIYVVAMALIFCGGGQLSTAAEQAASSQQGFAAPEESPVKAQLMAEHASLQPGAQTRIGVQFTVEEGWHIYASDPGDAGLPTRVVWSSPEPLSFGPLLWPRPQVFTDPGDLQTFGYAGRVILHSVFALLPTAPAEGFLPIQAEVSWVACQELCVPGSAQLELILPVSLQPPAPSADAELFDART